MLVPRFSVANNANMALGVKRRNKILNHCSNNNILCNISVTWEAPVFSKAITRMETTYPRKPAYTLVAADNCNYLIVYMCSFDKNTTSNVYSNHIMPPTKH